MARVQSEAGAPVAARVLDARAYRDRFPILGETTYLINHSLGAMPAAAEERIAEYARTWTTRGIRAWAEGWWTMPLTAAPAAPSTPAAGPPVPGLTRAKAAEAILAELRRQARKAAALSAPGDGIWDALSLCEAGARWAYNGPSGFDGGLQFHPATWSAYRLPALPEFAWQATRRQQIAVARRVLAEQGWQAWPVCSRKLGLR